MAAQDPIVTLKPHREKSVFQGHPWLFSGAILSEPQIEPGTQVTVQTHDHKFVAKGYYNPRSKIRVRIFSLKECDNWDRDLLYKRIKSASLRRKDIDRNQTDALRLVASDADLLSGLIIDQYGDCISFQILTAGMEKKRSQIIGIVKELFDPKLLIERSDDANRIKEGLDERKECLLGPTGSLIKECRENGMKFNIDLWNGHKTGFYLDQRENRYILRHHSRNYGRVLNLFSYTGGFSIACALATATEIISVDQSAEALELAGANCGINLKNTNIKLEFVKRDVFKYLRELHKAEEKFDTIIVDPPKLVFSKNQLIKSCRGYKDLNLYALRLLKPGGLLASFSCSGLVSADLFTKILWGATIDTQDQLQIIKTLRQAQDHPIHLSIPESLYLKGYLCRKL